MKVSFQLTMPNKGSWNGKWTGEGKLYVCVRRYFKKTGYGEVTADRILELLDGKDAKSFHYSWSDGWTACVTMRIVDARIGTKLQKQSSGFCNYEWMIDRILKYGKIISDAEVKKLKSVPA